MRFIAWVVGAVLVLAAGGLAWAHKAPSGWQYPGGCCAGMHCAPLPASQVERTADGYLIIPTGEVVPYELANSSLDSEYHYCTAAARHPPMDVFEWRPLRPSDRLHSRPPSPHYTQNRSTVCFFAPEGGV